MTVVQKNDEHNKQAIAMYDCNASTCKVSCSQITQLILMYGDNDKIIERVVMAHIQDSLIFLTFDVLHSDNYLLILSPNTSLFLSRSTISTSQDRPRPFVVAQRGVGGGPSSHGCRRQTSARALQRRLSVYSRIVVYADNYARLCRGVGRLSELGDFERWLGVDSALQGNNRHLLISLQSLSRQTLASLGI